MQAAALGFMLYSVFSVSKNLIQLPFHGARLCKLQRIGLTDMVLCDAVVFCKAQNVADGNAVDDLGGRKAIDLFCEDMFQPLVVVREAAAYFLAAVKPLDDFRDVQAGLHVGGEEDLVRVIEAAGVLLFQQIHHLFYHPLWGEDLVGFLRRDVVKDILGAALVEVIGQFHLQGKELLYRIIEHHRVEQMPVKVLLFAGGLVGVGPAVPQEAELFQRDAGDLLKDLTKSTSSGREKRTAAQRDRKV